MPRKRAEPAVEVRRYTLADGTVTQTYSVRWFDAAGKRRRETCASLEEADFERARVVLEQSRGGSAAMAVVMEPEPVGMTVSAFWEAWIADARTRLQRSTIKEYERVFRVRLQPRFGALTSRPSSPGWSASGAPSWSPPRLGPKRSAAR